VVVGLDFFYQAWNHGGSKLPINRDDFKQGIVRFPNDTDVQKSHEDRAGHGILLVGWDDDLEFDEIGSDGKPTGNKQKGFYLFKNSWGTDWFGVNNPNGAGYGYISQKYVEQYGSAYVDDVPML
jgi:C1A family cysteine protease